MPSPDATPGYSKAPRGLFVHLRGDGIFTVSSISPGSSLRQRPSRYAIRAGRNLPDKEFRYLRTVIVTAAVHRGFSSELAPLPLTFRHRAGVTPYMSPCGLAGSCVFGKQSLGPVHCGPLPLHQQVATRYTGHPFSRSYGVNLPSSLTRNHPLALVLSHLPTSVGLRYGRPALPPCGFSRPEGATELSLVTRGLPPTSRTSVRRPWPPAWLDAAAPAQRSACPPASCTGT
jgi:hypothetical protein